ncbi:YccF domain-containing protein [Oscillatoria sp. CS-180]|uniref:YccF domain-containing protein n=1 Tax=Oscillatoria sp. CS-180 TaxID=3021720 RepID=UPI00232D2F28|nr:YccF domain-containing protein [Oscillatoria sp. CS-180]MDB9526343.1 YccF domain-containing protein [Oscillatoria sp. CS-180]
MSLLGNIIWLIFGGFLSGVGYILGGISTCLTIIGLPFGLETIKIGIATFTPFGREIKKDPAADTALVQILNIVWIVVFGWAIALNHLIWGAILAITIIGLPFAKQHFKLMVLALFPFGRSFE